jgi:hypothetical protein
MFRRGTTGQQQSPTFVPDNGEPIWDYETKKLYIGDANTAGGIEVAMAETLSTLAGVNLVYNGLTKALDLNLAGVTTNDIAEGTNNKYFSATLAQAAVGTALVAGNPDNTGITFAYDDVDNKITAVVTGGGGTGGTFDGTLTSNLVLNGFDITGTGDIDITGDIEAVNISATVITAPSITNGNISLINNQIAVSTDTLTISNDNQNLLEIWGNTTDGSINGTPQINIRSSRGTVEAPTNNQPGDFIATINFNGYYNGQTQPVSSIISGYEPTAIMSDSTPASNLAFITNKSNGDRNISYFDSNGIFNAPIFLATSYTTIEMNAIAAPTAGMIIFNSSTNNFYGHNGTAWVAFTGP